MNENLTLKEIKTECAKHTKCEICKYDKSCVVKPYRNDEGYPDKWDLEKAPYGYLTDLAIRIHLNAKAHGFWDGENNIAEKIALCHSELSEALEELRCGNPLVYVGENGKPEGAVIELLDCVIRIFDILGFWNVDVDENLDDKMDYNEGRPYKHGKEF